LCDLLTVAPPERREVLEEQLRLLRRQVAELDRDQRDLDMALSGDGQGLGASARARVP